MNQRNGSDPGDPNKSAEESSPERGQHGSAPSPDPVAGTEPNATPAPLPHETGPGAVQRRFTHEGVEWIAYVSGRGAYGTGHWGLASLQAIHFARAESPERPEYEALIAAGRFDDLYTRELVTLFQTARRIVIPPGGATSVPRRFSRDEDLS